MHGAFNELWGPNEVKSRWLPAVRDGLWYHGAEIDDADVAVCFYGDLFRLDPETLDSSAWQRTRAGMSDMLSNFVGADTLDMLGQAVNEAAWERTVDLVSVFATDPSVGERARERLAELIDDDTEVVVAHSLGTVLGYELLAAHPELEVDLFVTLGSPLGTHMVEKTLVPPLDGGRGVWPAGVGRWVNVAAVGDKVTGDGRLAPRFGDRVEDRRVDNGYRAHDPEPYLNNPVVGGAIAEALGLNR